MPLPCLLYGARRCTALSKRTRLPCGNPAAFGCKTCRMHGARKPATILRGELHPGYVHGERTIEAIENYRQAMAELKGLASYVKSFGIKR